MNEASQLEEPEGEGEEEYGTPRDDRAESPMLFDAEEQSQPAYDPEQPASSLLSGESPIKKILPLTYGASPPFGDTLSEPLLPDKTAAQPETSTPKSTSATPQTTVMSQTIVTPETPPQLPPQLESDDHDAGLILQEIDFKILRVNIFKLKLSNLKHEQNHSTLVKCFSIEVRSTSHLYA